MPSGRKPYGDPGLAGRGAGATGLSGTVDPDTILQISRARSRTARRSGAGESDGEIQHGPGRDVTLSAPKPIWLPAMTGGEVVTVRRFPPELAL